VVPGKATDRGRAGWELCAGWDKDRADEAIDTTTRWALRNWRVVEQRPISQYSHPTTR
jgi:hypothetical protein